MNGTPIYCPKCGTFCGNQEDYMFLVLSSDVRCPMCGAVVIQNPQPMWSVL